MQSMEIPSHGGLWLYSYTKNDFLILLLWKSHGQRRLVGCSPWGCKESDMTEWLYFHFSLSCLEVGNGNPLQCSCLKNPRDRGAWWAAISGVAQSQTQLKRLSSSSSRSLDLFWMWWKSLEMYEKIIIQNAIWLYGEATGKKLKS